MESVVFYFLSGVSVATAVVVAVSQRTIYAVAALVGCFCAVAGLYLLVGAPVLAAVQFFFCAGAMGVVFPLAIVLLDAGAEMSYPSHRSRRGLRWGALLLGAILFGLLVTAVLENSGVVVPDAEVTRGSLVAMGQFLSGDYLLPFLATLVTVTVGLVGAVWLARH